MQNKKSLPCYVLQWIGISSSVHFKGEVIYAVAAATKKIVKYTPDFHKTLYFKSGHIFFRKIDA